MAWTQTSFWADPAAAFVTFPEVGDLTRLLGLGEDELPGGPGAVQRDALVEEGVADVRAEGGSREASWRAPWSRSRSS